MTTAEQDGTGALLPRPPAIYLPKLRWLKVLAISIFYFALTFHWTALSLIILPSQVLKIVGDAHKGEALAFVVIPGAFVSLFANPLFGFLSDQTRGRLAAWGRRRPYILFGTLVNVGMLVWMALAHDILSLAIAFSLVQFSSNAAQATFHALLPDLVPAEQRGMVSGVMNMLTITGSVAGVIVAGIFVDASKPLPAYQLGLELTYGIIGAVLLVFMLVTICSVREKAGVSAQLAELEATEATPTEPSVHERERRPSLFYNIGGTVVGIGVLWGLLYLWNTYNIAHIQITSDVQQVILELAAAIGLLRIFDFNPRRDPDFAWVLATRLMIMMGIYTIQTFLQYYMRDAVRVAHPEQQTTNFTIVVSIFSLLSAFFVGWLSDRFGRKLMIYIAGGFMAIVGLLFIVTQSLPLVLAAGALFGLGYGAYYSVDWALVADVLPSHRHYARDMGIWNVSLSVPQIIAPVLGGPLIDAFVRMKLPVLGFQLLFAMAIVYCVLGTVTVRFVKGVK
jgi:MFS family permease